MKETYRGKRVLVTGHTGFKGAWLSIWLKSLGAEVIGYSLEPITEPNLFELTQLENRISHHYGDIRNYSLLKSVIQKESPEVIFHLAAQSLVLNSYDNPRETFEVNTQGTVNLLEAARQSPSVKAIIVITTDKCYQNKEWSWGYRENDPLGGHDPYSASKSMAEIVSESYRKSFFQDGPYLATARAGNVIGGGDFSENRLIPDAMKALIDDKPIPLRNPKSVRPWVHVLDPLSGYLLLGKKLLEEGENYAQPWNFGPVEHQGISTQDLVECAIEHWGKGCWIQTESPEEKKEMGQLRLNWDKAANLLGWHPVYDWEEAVEETVYWFKSYQVGSVGMYEVCEMQIESYSKKAENILVPQ